MTATKTNLSCGCGFKTSSLAEAEKHAEDKKHCMTGYLTISVEKPTRKTVVAHKD